MYYDEMMNGWVQDQTPRSAKMQNEPAFYRNIEQALDKLRIEHRLSTAKPRWDDSVIDWTSSDFLSLNRSGRIREAFLEEMSKHKDWRLSASGSRTQYGNYNYLIDVEKEAAEFFGAETAYMGHSGFLCNLGIVGCVALPGDCYLYDELVHASTHEGMKLSRASHKVAFRHNDVESLRQNLSSLKEAHPEFEVGAKSVIILIESVYSMNGDVCPLQEFVDAAKEIFPLGNAQFIIDEAHSIGVLGPKGRGLVSMLGLEKEMAIRVHMCSKGMASTGGVILCNKTVRSLILSHMRFAFYGGAPSFPMVASLRAGLNLLRSGATEKDQNHIQEMIPYFFEKLLATPEWKKAQATGLLSCPLSEGWENRKFHTHVVPILTRPRHELYLSFHLLSANMNAYYFSYPVVPRGESRVRMVFHAHNTKEQIDKTVDAICDWAREMFMIEQSASSDALPMATRKAFAKKAILGE